MPGIGPDFRSTVIWHSCDLMQIAAGHLKIDGSRHAEVQDLADDVCRKKGEARAGELLRQPIAHVLM